MEKLDRRSVLRGGAIGIAGLAGGVLVGRELADNGGTSSAAAGGDASASGPASAGSTVAFRGAHQAGVDTPGQQHASFASFDVVQRDRAAVEALLATWTSTAETLAGGGVVSDDTGEATGMGPASLTVTFGFAASFFDDQCAPVGARPPGLVDLPAFDGDALEDAWSGGDVLVQVCADDPTVVSHAVRQLRRVGLGTVALRWQQNGFLPQAAGQTPRNLFGQVDGTANPAAGSSNLDELVWVGGDGAKWMSGGTYLGLRRIRMSLKMWDRMGLAVQEAAVGRSRTTGAPLSGGDEFTPMDLEKTDSSGALVIPADAHARVAKVAGPGMLRRGYSFDNGPRRVDGTTMVPSTPMDHSSHGSMDHSQMAAMMDDHDAGLMFVAFVRDPAAQFVAVQQALSASDALGHFLSYTSASLWAVPGGRESGSIAAGIYE